MGRKISSSKKYIWIICFSVFVYMMVFAAPYKVNAAATDVTTENELVNAIRLSAAGDTIMISDNITLTDKLPVIEKDITIDSVPGVKLIIADTMAGKRHFYVSSGAIVDFKNLIMDGSGTGGGIQSNGNIRVKDTEISNCFAVSGAAIFSMGALTIDNSNIHDNISTHYGGGIYIQSVNDVDIMINTTHFKSNNAYRGAGLYISGKNNAVITDSTFNENKAQESGGGIFSDSSIAVRNSTIKNNISRLGGGLSVTPSESTSELLDVKIENSMFVQNKAVDEKDTKISGGGLSVSAANVYLDGSEFTENETTGIGGAVYVGSGNLYVKAGSKIEKNKALIAGGGIYGEYVAYSNLNLPKSAIVIDGTQTDPVIIKDNISEQNGGGVYANEHTTLEITGFVHLIGNQAVKGNGGSIWTYSLLDVTAQKDVVFSDNKASKHVDPDIEDIETHKSHIFVSPPVFSKYNGKISEYAYNNYDINNEAILEVPQTGNTFVWIWPVGCMIVSISVLFIVYRKRRNGSFLGMKT